MEGCGAWLGSPGKGLGSPSLITLGSAKAHLWTCRDPACAGAVPVALGFLPGGCTPCMLIAPSACCPPSRLKRSGLKVRFCTNESQKARGALVGLLRQMGFTISEGEVTAPAPAACLILRERGLRPHLLVHEGGPAGLGTLPGGSCGWALPLLPGPHHWEGHRPHWLLCWCSRTWGWEPHGFPAGDRVWPSPASHQRLVRGRSQRAP